MLAIGVFFEVLGCRRMALELKAARVESSAASDVYTREPQDWTGVQGVEVKMPRIGLGFEVLCPEDPALD